MILFFESAVYNNPEPPQEKEVEKSPEDEFNEQITPIKRYYLISQLLRIQNNLSVLSYENIILNTIVKFIDNITYQHLIIIVPKLLEQIYSDLKRIQNEKTK